jgi:signal transduction histidine kinase
VTFASLRVRLLTGAAGFILAALALSALGLTVLFQRHVERWVDGELSAHLDQLIAGIDSGPGEKPAVTRPPADPRFEQPMSGLYWEVAVEPDGPVLRSRSLWDYAIPLPAEATVGDALHHHRVAGPDGSRLYLVQRRIELPGRLGGKTARVAVAIDAAEVAAAVRRFATALMPFLLLLSALLILAAWVQVSVGLRPLAAMRRKLAAIGAGERHRLGAGFPEEVQPLASEVDSLLDDRDRQIERARSRAADLAHGLRTPLQVLLGDAEQLKRKGEAQIAEEIEGIATAMQRHAERQLSRARMSAYNINASADVREIVERVVRVMKRTPEGLRLKWTVNVPAGINACIDPEDLAEAVGNLTENAVRHAKSRIAVSASTEAGNAVVMLTDDGHGIPLEQQNEVLVRGARLDSTGSGTGLGLAIVSDIAETWGARLSFEAGESSFGVRLRIPMAGK